MSNKELLLRVEHVKYRMPGAAKSPIGTFYVYEDRIEWLDNASDEKLVVFFSDIRGQRISPPNKTKTQLQICKHDEEQATFVFVNPLGKEMHVKDRDLVKEMLQQALIHHRQIVSQNATQSLKYSKTKELEAKKKILERNKHLQELYKHLVASKLISAQDFWSEYYQNKDADGGKLGVSSGFLSSIAQSEGTNGVKLNLNIDTIQSIFRTYPAVERKHLELVPHEMTEQEFWAKFFQSHYFHREREVAPSPSDPFADCIKADNAEMRKLLDTKIAHKTLDFSYIHDDPLINNISSLSEYASSTKDTLMKRFNYHSERVLLTTAENEVPTVADLEGQMNEESTKIDPKSREEDENEIMLESEELRSDKHEEELDLISFAVGGVVRPAKHYTDGQARAYRDIVQRVCEAMPENDDYDDDLEDDSDSDYEDLLRLATAVTEASGKNITSELTATDLVDLQAIHDSVAELLKHFWMCFPPMNPDMDEKLKRMNITLRNFEETKIASAEERFGKKNLAHCRQMLSFAYARYDAYLQKKKK
ncbi:BSD domain-containing protein [Loa loa]|uniref:BSD domain-containing protein n=1 Tax=Loa loa TaxID=7209 RepID=A0A1I7VTS4_LOALO|nr:BSD domain-containing protein [Loa loa]EFO22480.2 BSD domain-containing protein [Loa loa]